MSTLSHIIEERPANIGNFLVGRLLPFRQKRMVGPFIFIDHMGPAVMDPEHEFDVDPHPHIGLATLTYLFDGAVMHRDSLGTELEILPGQVNWMTAGKGIVHSERTPDRLRGKTKTMHGLQIWVALPKELEECEPSFYHANENELPNWKQGSVNFRLVAGEVMGRKSGVPVYSPMYLLEICSEEQAEVIDFKGQLFGESGIYILDGSIEAEGETFGTKQLLVTQESGLCSFTIQPNSKIYIFGGEPFEEERHIYWNFVSTSKERIEEAKRAWKAQEFPKIPGETSFVPLPE